MSIQSEITRISTEVGTQTDLIEQIKTALNGKAVGGETGVSPVLINFTLTYGTSGDETTVNAQAEEGMTWGEWVHSEYNAIRPTSTDYTNCIVVSVLCPQYNSSIGSQNLQLGSNIVYVWDEIQSGSTYTAVIDMSGYQ